MKYRCKCNNESIITFNNFQRGNRCKKCSNLEIFTFKFVQNFFKEQN